MSNAPKSLPSRPSSHAPLLASRAQRSAAPVSPLHALESDGPEATRQAIAVLLGRARELVDDGVTPRQTVPSLLEALQPVLEFVRSQPALEGEPSLSPAMCRAVLRVAQELSGGADEPLCIPPPRTVQHEEALRTGVLLLAAYRAAVERGLYGGSDADDYDDEPQPPATSALAAQADERIRTEFGLDEELNLGSVRDGIQLAERIARFLAAAERFPEQLIGAGLSGAQLMGLAAQERVLRALDVRQSEAALAPGQPYRAQVLHAALGNFFDRYSAALWVRLIDRPDLRAEGLKLLPRPGGPRSSGRQHPGLDFSSCRITDSGRLVFN